MKWEEYLVPTSLEQALTMLKECPGQARVIAGGTDLIIQLKKKEVRARRLVDITNIGELKGIELEGDFIRIGACVTHQELASSSLIRERAAALAEGASQIGSPQIRNIGTVGGNIVNAQPAADAVVHLVALNAEVEIATAAGIRREPLRELCVGPGQSTLDTSAEILTAVRFRALGALPRFSWTSYRAARRWIRDGDIRLVHANGPFGLLYCGLAARQMGRPVVFTSHLSQDVDSFFKRWLLRSIPGCVLAVSASIAAGLAAAGVERGRIRHVPLGIDAAAYAFDEAARQAIRGKMGWGEGDIVCGAIGRIQRVKGQMRFLDALALARRQVPALKGVIAGSAWTGDADARAYEGEIDAALASRGDLRAASVHLPQTDDARGLLSAIDLLVVASDSESFGRIVVEAMACGRPVVTTPCGGPQEIVADGQTGFVAKTISADALAAALAAMALSESGARAQMGRQGRQRAAQEFCLSLQIERTTQAYAVLLGLEA